MNQTVRVGLVFPRSGQQVFVLVPHHVAEQVARRYDLKLSADTVLRSPVPGSCSTGERTPHAQ